LPLNFADHFFSREQMNPSAKLISDFRFPIFDFGEDKTPNQKCRQDSQSRCTNNVG